MAEGEKRNVVWLLVDDLRPQLNQANGQDGMMTPRLDALARESVVFDRAYCQLPVCSPSRNSFLTGRRPDSLRVYNFESHFRQRSSATSVFEYFKSFGYRTIGSGKTFQPNKPPDYDGTRSWSVNEDSRRLWYLPLIKNQTWCPRRNARGKRLDVCPLEVEESQFMDRKIADFVVDAIHKAKHDKFFAVAGFYRPHLRWVVPARFYETYRNPPTPPKASRHKPEGMPDLAWTNEGCHTMTTADRTGIIDMNSPLDAALQSELRKGYFACVSWIDYLCGLVLDATPKDAIVIFSSDHGFHLGEQASWTKHTLFELSARVPLMIRDPRVVPRHTKHIVELVDIFRTVVDIAGLPPPSKDLVQGRSLSGILHDTAAAEATTNASSFAISQYPRCPKSPNRLWETNCKREENIPIMGYTIRTDGYRFTEWYRFLDHHPDVVQLPPLATELYAYDDERLFDYDNSLELVNIAHRHPCAVDLFRKALLTFVRKCQWDAHSAECQRNSNSLSALDQATRAVRTGC